MESKTPIVMISSTVLDLQEHREAVKDACISQHMLPKMMEHLPASDESGLNASLSLVDQADFYLAVLGHRYGHVPKGKTKSITHYEYDRATSRGIPRFIFLMHGDHPLKASDVEKGSGGQRLERFKKKLASEHTIKFFRSVDELRSMVINTLSEVNKNRSKDPAFLPVSNVDEAAILTARLNINQDPLLLQKVGCPCLQIKLTCQTTRPAKIAQVRMHVRGPHILKALQGAFSTNLGFNDGEVELVNEPSFFIVFLPTTPPDTAQGYIIEQDDTRAFIFPSINGTLVYFAEAPPTDVFIQVKYLNGREETVLQGIEVQRGLPSLIRMCLDRRYSLNPSIVIPMGFTASATQSPDVPTGGFTNDQTFHLPAHPRRDFPIDKESDTIRLRAKILRAGGDCDPTSEEWLSDLVREHSDKDVRRDAIVSLRRLATPSVRDFFYKLLDTENNENTRELLIRSFAVVGTADDISNMERLTRTESSRFCKEAAAIAFHLLRHRFSTEDEAKK